MSFGAPAAPDYKGAAEAQATSQHNNVNTPWGSYNWSQDPNSHQWTGTMQLTPDQQAALDQQQGIQREASGVAGDLIGQARDKLSTPMDWGSLPQMPDAEGTRRSAIDATYNRSTSRLNPMWGQRENEFESKAANQGITPGTDAYNTARKQFDLARNDAYTTAGESAEQYGAQAAQQMFGMGVQQHQQGVSDAMMQRMQPLNEMEAALHGQQVQMPNMPGMYGPGTNYSGAAGQQGQYALQSQQMTNQMWADLMQGGGQIASMAPMMFM